MKSQNFKEELAMKPLKYKVIKSREQYDEYCDILEQLVFKDEEGYKDDIELLELLIEKWDSEHNSFNELNPVDLLQALMSEHNLKAKDLAEILDLSKGTVSKILNYNKGFSKETIRKLSEHFKISQAAFNREYNKRA